MYNDNYTPTEIDSLTPKVTVGEAIRKASLHAKVIQNSKGELSDDQLMTDYIALGYYNQIILKSKIKASNGVAV